MGGRTGGTEAGKKSVETVRMRLDLPQAGSPITTTRTLLKVAEPPPAPPPEATELAIANNRASLSSLFSSPLLKDFDLCFF